LDSLFPSSLPLRKIIHIDMDAFYASVEQRDFPELRGKPIAVGGNEKRGVVTTASYEARKFGVRSAMPGWKAKQLCPNLIFTPLRYEAYRDVSHKIREIFHRYTDLVEPLSLDEAYLDVTSNFIDEPIATKIAKRIKHEILEETNLTASAGVSYCKFLAKIASDYQKPNGLTIIKPENAIPFIEQLPIEKFFGVGKVTADKMHNLGIYSGLDLKEKSDDQLRSWFGKSGQYFYNIVRGIDNRPVEPHYERKSLAFERTFDDDVTQVDEARKYLTTLADRFWNERLHKYNFNGKTLTLKLKNSDFQIKTRSISIPEGFGSLLKIQQYSQLLLDQNTDLIQRVRLIGLTVSNPM
jgi:DNA polymerase IV